MITWPFFGEQFLNEKFVVEVLEIGVSVGAKAVVHVGEEHKCGVLVKREEIRKGVERVIGEGKEGEERRKKAKELGEMANRAIEEGGSSQLNITMLIQDIIQQAKNWSSC
ncbi:anthocyanidin 3-O-glucosyltransferase 4-like [Cornus florida]|nr:anthocyanidin 3-O-glucosyltransferase 4-like [Cornus florida]